MLLQNILGNIGFSDIQLFYGDMNQDQTIDVLDVILVVNIVLSGEPNQFADVNDDGFVNILDLVIMVNWIINVINFNNSCWKSSKIKRIIRNVIF